MYACVFLLVCISNMHMYTGLKKCVCVCVRACACVRMCTCVGARPLTKWTGLITSEGGTSSPSAAS